MRSHATSFALLCCLGLIRSATAADDAPRTLQADVVIYGGTSAGLAAAVQTVRMGKSALVIEPRMFLGGLSTSGLGWTDTGDKSVIGGLSREFYQRIKRKYDEPARWRHEEPAAYKSYRPADDALWAFEPHVASEVFADWIHEHALQVLTGVRCQAISFQERSITGLLLSDGRLVTGRRFIDASYEGDLLDLAAVSFTVGREANATYGETLNGVQKARAVSHQFIKPVDPWLRPGDPASGLLPDISPWPGEDGSADDSLQAFNYRLCITDVRENQIPFARPADYDELLYELLLRNFEAGDLRLPLSIIMVPNRKTDVNNNHAVSTDWIGRNHGYVAMDPVRRAEFERQLQSYTRGLLWTLAEHPRVPETIRREVGRWGWAQDEWTDNDHWPYWPYIREARRMVSDHVHTELDCRRLRPCPDPVGMGSYNMDSHNCLRYVDEQGHVRNEGDIQVSPRGPYQISYRALTPRREECTNLLVPVCVSCSHIAYGSIRMEPVFMILGQSAATAACLSINAGVTVQDLDYAALRAQLDADGQVLTLPAGASAAVPDIDPKSLPGVVVDDDAAQKTGDWQLSSSAPGFVGSGYVHDAHEGLGEKSLVYELIAPHAGRWNVRLSYTFNSNRATNVPVRVETPDGPQDLTINQRQPPPLDGRFATLGDYTLPAGGRVRVTITNHGADGHVIGDAVQLLPVP